jgi:general secretion pathway protein J
VTTRFAEHRGGEAGFTLIEALLALALTGLVLSALANITAQWLPSWNRGVDRIQESELIGITMQRIANDVSAAEYVPASRDRGKPMFDGSAFSVTFVRTALGPNVGIGLDVVRIGQTTDQGRVVTVRTRAPFGPLLAGASASDQIQGSDPVVLLRPPLQLSFSYAGPDRIFRDSWHDQDNLPAAIMLTVRDPSSERVLSASSVTPVHVAAPAYKKSDHDSKTNVNDNSNIEGRSGGATPNQGGN